MCTETLSAGRRGGLLLPLLYSARSEGLRWALGTGATLGLSLDFIRCY